MLLLLSWPAVTAVSSYCQFVPRLTNICIARWISCNATPRIAVAVNLGRPLCPRVLLNLSIRAAEHSMPCRATSVKPTAPQIARTCSQRQQPAALITRAANGHRHARLQKARKKRSARQHVAASGSRALPAERPVLCSRGRVQVQSDVFVLGGQKYSACCGFSWTI